MTEALSSGLHTFEIGSMTSSHEVVFDSSTSEGADGLELRSRISRTWACRRSETSLDRGHREPLAQSPRF